MTRPPHPFSAVLLLFLLTALSACDKVHLNNPGAGENGVLVDGSRGGTDRNDVRYTRNGADILMGNYKLSTQSNEVIAYTTGKPPILKENAAWTNGRDTIAVSFDNKYRVPFYIWIVKGPFATQQTVAINACVKTSQIWTDERQGIGFSVFQINDATADPDAASFHAFDCG
jgi:hypothetical protein